MKFKDVISVIMGKEILQFTLTEVNKNCGGKFTGDKYWYFQTVISLAAEIK